MSPATPNSRHGTRMTQIERISADQSALICSIRVLFPEVSDKAISPLCSLYRLVQRKATGVVRRTSLAYNAVGVRPVRGPGAENQQPNPPPEVPELPEVETVVRDLRPHLVGRRIASVEVGKRSLRRPWQPEWDQYLIGRSVHEVRRRGKWIVAGLDEGAFLVIHLGMTGQLTVVPTKQQRVEHTHLVVGLDRGGRQLRFSDIRRFGSATVFDDAAQLEQFFEKSGLGPEPFDLIPKYWQERLTGTDRCLKAVLLDQRVVAGVGNIYADESLFQARLHPSLRGRDISSREAGRLRRAIVTVLNRAINKRGSSIRNYVGGSGLQGEYQREFRVYGQTGKPCPRCRTLIERIRLAGRSTHFCPQCQRLSFSREPQASARSPAARG